MPVKDLTRRNFIKVAGNAAGVTVAAVTGVGVTWASEKPAECAEHSYPVNPEKPSPKSHKHKGEFSVITVGTGCPASVFGRSGPCTMVQYKGKYFLVDIGAGTTTRIVEAGIPLGDINNIFITHMHTDHTDGYFKFMIESWTMGRRNTKIYGTEGVKALHNVFQTVFPEDIQYRTGKTKTLDGMYDTVDIAELQGVNSFVVDSVTVTTGPTIHSTYNLAYRFDADGKSIVVSGDTSYSEKLIQLSKDADILVIDSGRVMNDGYIGPGERPLRKKRKKGPSDLVDPTTYVPKEEPGKNHATLEDVAIMAEKAGVKKLVLTHYPPVKVNQEGTLKRYKQFYNGEVIFGRDLLETAA
jgi:ribonuclease BN (tRNA processing enzyme)